MNHVIFQMFQHEMQFPDNPSALKSFEIQRHCPRAHAQTLKHQIHQTIQRVCFAFDQMADVEIFTCIDFSMCNAHFTSNNILIRVVLLVTSIHAECDSYANDYASRKCSFYLHVHLLTIIFCSSAYILTLTILCIGWIQKLSIRYGVYIFQFRTE